MDKVMSCVLCCWHTSLGGAVTARTGDIGRHEIQCRQRQSTPRSSLGNDDTFPEPSHGMKCYLSVEFRF
jgi:hypothetical protein